MNPWPFVIGAYGVTLLVTAVLLWRSHAAMRRAEREADAVQRR